MKQQERDIIRSVLEKYPDKVNVADFKKDVESELLPLSVKSTRSVGSTEKDYPKYEFVNLPENLR